MADAGRVRGWPGLAAAVLLVHLVLVMPSHPAAATWGALRLVPLELPFAVILLAAAPASLRAVLRSATTAILLAVVVLKTADLTANTTYLRPFNPALDLYLLPAAGEMLGGTIGRPATAALGAGALAVTAGLAAALWWATGRIAALALPRPALLLLVPATGLMALGLAPRTRPYLPGDAFTARLAWQHAQDARQALRDLADFRLEAALDPYADLPETALMAALDGRDVLLMFAESYGRTALSNPLYAPTLRATLAAAEAPLAAAGLEARSAFLVSPVVGGESWLAHSTLLSGLRIDDQGRYRALVRSPYRSLVALAASAGWQTAAVMPAITRAWPEAEYFGHQTLLAAGDLGYRGLPFNWVTMPDQFTLAAFERLLLDPAPRAPVFAEIALISSHAPWTPIPPRLPWEALGDGSVFDPYATAGDPPSVVWRDQDRVRDQFRQALDYTLATALDFAARRAEATPLAPPLVILLGDHQPAAFVSQGYGAMEVPVHLIGSPELVARIDDWGWSPGLLPDDDAPTWPMEAFRDRFLRAFAAFEPACGDAPLAFGAKPLPAGPSC